MIGGAIGVGLLGATLGWELAHRLADSGATGINVAAALRPETHKLLTESQLAAVQLNLGLTLRDIYFQMTVLALGTMVCALWLPNKHATLKHSATHEREAPENERLAVAVSEL